MSWIPAASTHDSRRVAAARAMGALLAVFAALLARVAGADEGSSPDIGRDSMLLKSRVGVEVAAAHFHLDKAIGQYLVTTALADITVRERLSLRVVVPLDDLALDGASHRAGVGDVLLRIKLRLFESKDWLVQASLSAQFPTGDTHLGLGNGAPTLSPLVTAGYEVGRLIVFVTVSDASSLRRYGPAPADYVDPSTDEEILVTAGAHMRIARGLFAQLTATPIFPLLAADRAHWFFSATPTLGWSNPLLRIAASVGVPIAGTFRFDERVAVNAQVFIP